MRHDVSDVGWVSASVTHQSSRQEGRRFPCTKVEGTSSACPFCGLRRLGRTIHPTLIFLSLCLLFPAALHAEGRVLKGNVMLIGAHDELTPTIGATVSLKGAGNPVQTKQGGEFRLVLPDIYKPGEDITLNVEMEGYQVFHPVGGETKVPANLDKQFIDIHLMPVGSRKFLSEAQIEYLIKTAAAGESKVQVAAQGAIMEAGEALSSVAIQSAANITEAADFIQKWASQYGFTEAQVMEAIRKWVAQTQQEQADFYKLGLAAFAEKNFRKARELFTQSGENNEKKLEEAREAAVRDFRLAGDAAYNDYRFGEALASYQRAFKHTSKEQTPVLWAAVLINIGNAQWAMGLQTHGADIHQRLAEAVAAYRAALEVRTREAVPQDWATIQNNLGNALSNQGIRTAGEAGAKLRSEAVAAYRAALDVYTRESLPQDWAASQNNLGAALKNQGIRTAGEAGAKLLNEAVAAYRAALEVFARESLPQWATTQNNLARAYTALEDWPKAAAGYAQLLHANFDDGDAYQKAGWLYHEKLSDFGAAFALTRQWLERHPEDLFAQGDFAERHFTTGRFVEAKERLAVLLMNPELDPRIRIGLQALEIATLLALNDTRAVLQRLERLRAEVQRRPQDFQIGWSFAGSKHFIATDPCLAPHRAWLQTLFTALEGENRDAILAALDGMREKLTQREGPRYRAIVE